MRFTAYGATSLFPYAAAVASMVWQCGTFHSSASNRFYLCSECINTCIQLKLCHTPQTMQSRSFNWVLVSRPLVPLPALCAADSVSDCSLGSIRLGFATYFQSKRLAHRCVCHGDVKLCERAALCNTLCVCAYVDSSTMSP